MLTVDIEDFMLEFKDGVVHHVGASNKRATVKLYDVTDAEARTFGDERVKLAFTDEDDNEVEVALFPDQASELATAIGAAAADLPED
ncbi:MAG: hypothetical protein ABEJ70_07395 [Halobacteriaceae archaeon]